MTGRTIAAPAPAGRRPGTRLFRLLPLLFVLSGCSALAAGTPQTEPVPPPVLVMSSPEAPSAARDLAPTEPDPGLVVDITEPPSTVPSPAATTEPAPAQTSEASPEPPPPAIPYQRGDTTPTWRPELAAQYPADADCSAALLLEKWMAVEGLRPADLDERDCRQLILVVARPADSATTLTVCFERAEDGAFRPVAGLDRLQGFVGKNGIQHDRRRNTNTTPAGLWAIGTAFGNEPPPDGLKLPWRQVTPNSDWVCDDQSPYFNTWQERDDPSLIPWSDDAEHLADYPTQYAWACVIEFNRPPDVVPDRGCAIFLHCSRGGTGGCVGLRREDMRAVLRWLDAEKHPYILIAGAQLP